MAKIAVVEDNDAMRAQLCGFIAQYAQESGHQLDVTAFSDGAQLVEPYRPGFDIIFLDIEMPKLGGMPTAERIRRQDPDAGSQRAEGFATGRRMWQRRNGNEPVSESLIWPAQCGST